MALRSLLTILRYFLRRYESKETITTVDSRNCNMNAQHLTAVELPHLPQAGNYQCGYVYYEKLITGHFLRAWDRLLYATIFYWSICFNYTLVPYILQNPKSFTDCKQMSSVQIKITQTLKDRKECENKHKILSTWMTIHTYI